jgi:EAL domain-containing protein (putative c-di-GMP-specific phosphodiesterase class I)/GGDEF domain-containing protein
MASEKNENYNLIRKKHILPSLLGLILAFVLVVCVAFIVFNTVFDMICEAKLDSEYNAVKHMASMYDNALDKESVKSLFDSEKRDYFLADAGNNILYQKGENTCTFKGGDVSISDIEGEIQVYYDSKCDDLSISNKTLDLSVTGLLKKVKFSDIFKPSENEEEASLKPVTIPFDFWISIGLSDGSTYLVAKAAYEVKARDLALFVLLFFIAAFVAGVLFVVKLISIIRKFRGRKRLLTAFFTDVVTKGHNWTWFTIKGEQLLRKKKNDKLNYAVLDILFVKYNTFCVCHSVQEGEQVLEDINRMISRTLKKEEACAHHGTASFAVLIQYDNEEILRKRIKLLLKYIKGVEKIHRFSFHIGVALIPAEKLGDGKYLRRKDIKIEKVYNDACAATASLAASDDSAVAFFDNKLVEEQRWIDTVNERQQQALDNEEFVVYYQPKYNPSTRQLQGAEALIRWQSPEFGFVSPGKFIPIFEKNGFITEIDHYMITHVARDQRRWLDQGYRCVPVSVNVSRAHFIESDLAEQIRDAIDNEGAPREFIEIELTESAFFDDKKALIGTIEKLKSYGFSVSMDDFGAGYSSLNSLKDMPLDVLKLDADFFRGESEGKRGEIVVSEAIRLAKCLNMRTVAEGVEVKEQVEFLAGQGCDMIQGYYFAKPMPGIDYEQRMAMGYSPVEDDADKAADVMPDEQVNGTYPYGDDASGIQDKTEYGETVDVFLQDVPADESEVIQRAVIESEKNISSAFEEIQVVKEITDEPVYCDPDPAETDLGMEESVNGSTETDNTENDTIITDLH